MRRQSAVPDALLLPLRQFLLESARGRRRRRWRRRPERHVRLRRRRLRGVRQGAVRRALVRRHPRQLRQHHRLRQPVHDGQVVRWRRHAAPVRLSDPGHVRHAQLRHHPRRLRRRAQLRRRLSVGADLRRRQSAQCTWPTSAPREQPARRRCAESARTAASSAMAARRCSTAGCAPAARCAAPITSATERRSDAATGYLWRDSWTIVPIIAPTTAAPVTTVATLVAVSLN